MQTCSGQRFELRLPSGMTGDQIIDLLLPKLPFSPDGYNLLHNGNRVCEAPLEDWGLEDDDAVDIMAVQTGGGGGGPQPFADVTKQGACQPGPVSNIVPSMALAIVCVTFPVKLMVETRLPWSIMLETCCQAP